VTEYALKSVAVRQFQNYVEAWQCPGWAELSRLQGYTTAAASGRANSDKAIRHSTGRPSVIPTARRRDPRVHPYQMSRKQQWWCSNEE